MTAINDSDAARRYRGRRTRRSVARWALRPWRPTPMRRPTPSPTRWTMTPADGSPSTASSGEVTVNAALDYETNTSHSVTVRATSADGSSSTQSYTISVDRRQRVRRHADRRQRRHSRQRIAENAAIGSTVGVTAFSARCRRHAIRSPTRLDDNAGGRFAIDAGTGIVTVADGRSTAKRTPPAVRSPSVPTSSDGSFQTRSVHDRRDRRRRVRCGSDQRHRRRGQRRQRERRQRHRRRRHRLRFRCGRHHQYDHLFAGRQRRWTLRHRRQHRRRHRGRRFAAGSRSGRFARHHSASHQCRRQLQPTKLYDRPERRR